jgi:hypothetical protein
MLAKDNLWRTMKVATSADDAGSCVQDSTRVSSAHDTSNGIDFYFIRVTNFSSLLWMQQGTELSSSSRGDLEESKDFKLHALPWRHFGRT